MPHSKPRRLNELQSLHDQCIALLEVFSEQSPLGLNADRWKGVLAALLDRDDLRGMRRAARELRQSIAALQPADRYALLQEVRSRTGGSPGRLDKPDRRLVDKIVTRGRIRDDAEYYALRSYLDSLEGRTDQPGKARKVAALLERYTS